MKAIRKGPGAPLGDIAVFSVPSPRQLAGLSANTSTDAEERRRVGWNEAKMITTLA